MRKAAGRRGERAQSLVEFALVLPIFLILVLAAVDFGMALKSYVTVTNSAREGARLATVGESENTVKTKVVERSGGIVAAGDVTVTGELGISGAPVTVSVTYKFNYITPLGGLLSALTGGTLPDPLPMSASTTMRME